MIAPRRRQTSNEMNRWVALWQRTFRQELAAPDVVAQTASDLEPFLHAKGLRLFSRGPRVLLRAATLSPSEAMSWEARLEHLRQDCGCRAGTVGLCLFTLALVLYSVEATHPASMSISAAFLRLTLWTGGLIASAGTGKLVGLYIARVRFRATCRQIVDRLPK